MKKTYQNPEIKVIKVETVQMIAASTEMYGKDATGAAMGRRGSYNWDEDDEEEY